MRLNHYLASCGVASRRKCDQLIIDGKVSVNKKKVTDLATFVTEFDEVAVNGKVVKLQKEKYYILINKPADYITTTNDPHKRPTVLSFVKTIPARLFPIGRLDRDTEGLLLMTNDGMLSHRLTHPKYEVEKVYVATVEGRPSSETINKLENGIVLDGEMTAPTKVVVLKEKKDTTVLQITMKEGRKRQVRRMCAELGHPVLYLKRIKYAFLTLEGVQPGKWRHLTEDEVKRLKKLVGL